MTYHDAWVIVYKDKPYIQAGCSKIFKDAFRATRKRDKMQNPEELVVTSLQAWFEHRWKFLLDAKVPYNETYETSIEL